MNIGIDIDGVLAQFDQDFKNILIQVSGRDLPTPDPPPVWDWDVAAGYQPHEINRAWQQVRESSTFWENLPPLPGAADLAERMPWANHAVYFITSRPGYRPKHQTERWLKRHLGIENPTVLVSSNKGPLAAGLKLDTFIDDKPGNVIDVKNHFRHCRPYVMTYPYNVTLVTPYRVSSVREWLDKEGL